MGMNVGGGGRASANMNVTPMIDVLLVLLIIFMLITPYYGEKVEIPQPSKTPEAAPPPGVPNPTVVLQIHFVPGAKPELKLNDETVTWEQLKARLQVIYADRKEKVIFVKGDTQLDWQEVATAIDIAHTAEIDKVGLLTDRMQAGQ